MYIIDVLHKFGLGNSIVVKNSLPTQVYLSLIDGGLLLDLIEYRCLVEAL